MADLKRYAIDLDLWIYGENEEEARCNLWDLINKVKKMSDNNANVRKMTEVPFGSLWNQQNEVKDHSDPREVIPF